MYIVLVFRELNKFAIRLERSLSVFCIKNISYFSPKLFLQIFLVYGFIFSYPLEGMGRNKNPNKEENPVVATFGNYNITLDEYKLTYIETLKQPEVFDSKETREKILNELIAGKILAFAAEKMNLVQDEEFKIKEAAYHDKGLREAHFRNVIKPMINVDDNQIRKVYKYCKEQRELKHLFFQTKTAADSIYDLLQNGVSFDSLAKEIFKDTSLANSGGNLGWVYWDQLDYDMAMTAFTLSLNQYSPVVKSRYGYHILKVVNYKVNPLITEYEYRVHKYKSKLLLEYQLADKVADEYIGKLLKQAKVKVYPNIMKDVRDKVSSVLKRKPGQFDNMSEFQLTNPEIKTLHYDFQNELDKTLAVINGQSYTVGNFLGELNYIPYSATYTNFTTAFNYAVRDFLITEEAKKMGLEKDLKVETKTNLFKAYFASVKLKQKLVDDVSISENEIKEYYNANQAEFKNAPFNEVSTNIKEQLIKEKKMTVVQDYVEIMMKNMEVVKHLDIINNYYDNFYSGKYPKEDSL